MLNEYDERKGTYRKLFGDNIHIKALRACLETELRNHHDQQEIAGDLLRSLYQLLCDRSLSLREKDIYYNKANLTNHIFHKIIFALAEEQFEAKENIRRRIVPEKQNAVLEKLYSSTDGLRRQLVKWVSPYFISNENDAIEYPIFSYIFLKLANYPDFYNDYNQSENIPFQIKIDPDEFPHVIANFSYSDVLRQHNADRLGMDALEDLDPLALALTDSGNLIYLDDVVTLYKQTDTFRNPQSVNPDTHILTDESPRKITQTKPLFRQVLRDEFDRRLEEKGGEAKQAYLTLDMVERIQRAGLLMLNDYTGDYRLSCQAISELRVYIYNLPTSTMNFILDTWIGGETMREVLNMDNTCRHTIGSYLLNISNGLRYHVNGVSDPLVDILHPQHSIPSRLTNGLDTESKTPLRRRFGLS